MGKAQITTRCELCLGTTHSLGECALQGDPDPEMRSRVKAEESVVLALTAKPKPFMKNEGGLFSPSGQVCRLWNRNNCCFPQCRHAHVCSSCGGTHPATSCPAYPQRAGQPSGQGPATMPTHRPQEWSKPYLHVGGGNIQGPDLGSCDTHAYQCDCDGCAWVSCFVYQLSVMITFEYPACDLVHAGGGVKWGRQVHVTA